MAIAVGELPGRNRSIEDVVLQHEIEQFLYREAALLDERRFHDWFALLADDLEYWMPLRTTRAGEKPRQQRTTRVCYAGSEELSHALFPSMRICSTSSSRASTAPRGVTGI